MQLGAGCSPSHWSVLCCLSGACYERAGAWSCFRCSVCSAGHRVCYHFTAKVFSMVLMQKCLRTPSQPCTLSGVTDVLHTRRKISLRCTLHWERTAHQLHTSFAAESKRPKHSKKRQPVASINQESEFSMAHINIVSGSCHLHTRSSPPGRQLQQVCAVPAAGLVWRGCLSLNYAQQ